jgi:hypothetical protein
MHVHIRQEHLARFSSGATAGFPTRSLDPRNPSLQIQIPPPRSTSVTDDTPSPTPFPGPESAPPEPIAHSTAQLEHLLLPPQAELT